MKKLGCYFGLHSWVVEEGEKLYSKGGILLPAVTLGVQRCACGVARKVHRVSSLFGGPHNWRVTDDAAHAAIAKGFLSFAELRAWREARDEARITEYEGTPCKCGGTWERHVSEQRFKDWIGLSCSRRDGPGPRCYEPPPAYYLKDNAERMRAHSKKQSR